MWTYSQSTGKLSQSRVGYVATGYAGNGQWKNNPEAEGIRDHGPIPRGRWRIVSMSEPGDKTHGGAYLRLEPAFGTKTYDRSGFLVHGDSVSEPGTASQGCIILPRLIRWAIWGSGDRDLEVTP